MALPDQMAAPISSLPSSHFCVQVSVQLHFLTPDSCVYLWFPDHRFFSRYSENGREVSVATSFILKVCILDVRKILLL